jgi:hypothetical protein
MTELSMTGAWDAVLGGLADDEWRPNAAILEGSRTGVVIDQHNRAPQPFHLHEGGHLVGLQDPVLVGQLCRT